MYILLRVWSLEYEGPASDKLNWPGLLWGNLMKFYIHQSNAKPGGGGGDEQDGSGMELHGASGRQEKS